MTSENPKGAASFTKNREHILCALARHCSDNEIRTAAPVDSQIIAKCPKPGTRKNSRNEADWSEETVTADWLFQRSMPEPNTGCLLWIGTTPCRHGYGRIRVIGRTSPVLVHRIAFELAHGPIPAGMKVCHCCDTPACLNPDHLFLGTQRDNLRDMYDKGRARPFGVPYRDGDSWRVAS
jgi:hypothetical protein